MHSLSLFLSLFEADKKFILYFSQCLVEDKTRERGPGLEVMGRAPGRAARGLQGLEGPQTESLLRGEGGCPLQPAVAEKQGRERVQGSRREPKSSLCPACPSGHRGPAPRLRVPRMPQK